MGSQAGIGPDRKIRAFESFEHVRNTLPRGYIYPNGRIASGERSEQFLNLQCHRELSNHAFVI